MIRLTTAELKQKVMDKIHERQKTAVTIYNGYVRFFNDLIGERNRFIKSCEDRLIMVPGTKGLAFIDDYGGVGKKTIDKLHEFDAQIEEKRSQLDAEKSGLDSRLEMYRGLQQKVEEIFTPEIVSFLVFAEGAESYDEYSKSRPNQKLIEQANALSVYDIDKLKNVLLEGNAEIFTPDEITNLELILVEVNSDTMDRQELMTEDNEAYKKSIAILSDGTVLKKREARQAFNFGQVLLNSANEKKTTSTQWGE